MPKADKNLVNTVKDLERQTAVNAHQANQLEQKENDRRKEMLSDDANHKANENSAYD